MNHVNRQLLTDQQQYPSTVLKPWLTLLDRIHKTEPLKFVWWCLATSIVSSVVARQLPPTGFVHALLVVVGSGGCAWFWLLSRTLFRKNHVLWSKGSLLVPVVIVVEGLEALWSPGVNAPMNELLRVFSNVAMVVCISVIVFVCHEILNGFSKIRSKHERRFRMAFLGVFGLPVIIGIFWLMGAKTGTFAGDWYEALLAFCGLIALVGSRLAVDYRLRTTAGNLFQSNIATHEISDQQANTLLANKILDALNDEQLLTQTDLKVATFANHIGEQEYKVTRCITGHLQFRNFNHLLNSHRIDHAIHLFKDASCQHLNIATIAYDCGFNSLGPFNKAFKQKTGMTPRAFRQQWAIEK